MRRRSASSTSGGSVVFQSNASRHCRHYCFIVSCVWSLTLKPQIVKEYLSLLEALLLSPLPQQQEMDIIYLCSGLGLFFFFLLIFKDEGKSEILLRPMFWTCLWWQLKEISYCNRTDCSPEMFFMLLDRDMTNIINMSHTYIKHDSAMRRQGLLLKSCCSPQNTKFPWMQVFDHWCCPVVSGPWLLFVNQAKLLKNKQKDPEKGSDK